MTAKDWKDAIAQAGCVLCRHLDMPQYGRTHVHHAREGQGMSQRASDWLGIGLCHNHHQGTHGWHGLGKGAFYTRYRLDEWDLLAMTIEGVARQL